MAGSRVAVVYAVVDAGRRMCGYLDREAAEVDAELNGAEVLRVLVDCPVDAFGFALLPDWFFGDGSDRFAVPAGGGA